jgi:hypothetical protein
MQDKRDRRAIGDIGFLEVDLLCPRSSIQKDRYLSHVILDLGARYKGAPDQYKLCPRITKLAGREPFYRRTSQQTEAIAMGSANQDLNRLDSGMYHCLGCLELQSKF